MENNSQNNTKTDTNNRAIRNRPMSFSSRRRKNGGPNSMKDQYKEKMIDLRRVIRVVKGGKRFSFRATVVIGDEKGKVGVGVAKGADVAQAISKAKNDAKNNMITVSLNGTTIVHEVYAKYSASRVLIKPSHKGSGLKAGGSVRVVLLMAGVKDATSKILSKTKNKLSNAFAAIEALNKLEKTKK